jgi:hypothetical protein
VKKFYKHKYNSYVHLHDILLTPKINNIPILDKIKINEKVSIKVTQLKIKHTAKHDKKGIKTENKNK